VGFSFISRERKPKFSDGSWKSVAPGQNRSNGFSSLKKEQLRSNLKRNILSFRIFHKMYLVAKGVHRAKYLEVKGKGASEGKRRKNGRKRS
jgi:hypothetical protein